MPVALWLPMLLFCLQVSDFGLSRVAADDINTKTYGTVTHMPPGALICVAALNVLPVHVLDAACAKAVAACCCHHAAYGLNMNSHSSPLQSSLPTAELLREGLLTKSADIFAFAVLMYEMYVGERCGLLVWPVCRVSSALGSV